MGESVRPEALSIPGWGSNRSLSALPVSQVGNCYEDINGETFIS